MSIKERPILFSGPMVRAILEGRKTQTRRIAKPQPAIDKSSGSLVVRNDGKGVRNYLYSWPIGGPVNEKWVEEQCPYGVPGDRLWVKENYRLGKQWDDTPSGMVFASPKPDVWYEADGPVQNGLDRTHWGRLRPSIHMPRKISRLTLEITGVRVERLQDISTDDAFAEGYLRETFYRELDKAERIGSLARLTGSKADNPPKAWYSKLWDEINDHSSWVANPWVWVVEFRSIKP